MGERETAGGGGVTWTWGVPARRGHGPVGGFVPEAPPAEALVAPVAPVAPAEPVAPDPEAAEATHPCTDSEAAEATHPRTDNEAAEATHPRGATPDDAQALEDWEQAGSTVRRSTLPPP